MNVDLHKKTRKFYSSFKFAPKSFFNMETFIQPFKKKVGSSGTYLYVLIGKIKIGYLYFLQNHHQSCTDYQLKIFQ